MYLMTLALLGLVTLLAEAIVRNRAVSPFVSIDSDTFDDPTFIVNGNPLVFVGTNAYWLTTLNSAEDIDLTLGNMSEMGINVVRTWAFNDVDTIPTSGTWFNLITNKTSSINLGSNGLQKLDTVVQLAQKHDIFLILSLTNNWNPRPLFNTVGANSSLPRNTLSNDFGGMDAYVRGFGNTTKHDEFYTNPTITAQFMDYTTTIVSRYVDSPAIFSWEIANDPRLVGLLCFSSLASSASCNTQTVTKFHDILSTHIKLIDANHLVSSGSHGFFCSGCPKIFPKIVTRREARGGYLSRMSRRWIFNSVFNKLRSPRSLDQGVGVGSAFDGSQGVDSEDILNIPGIAFGSLQLFPDQNSYTIPDPTLPAFDNMLNDGLGWIRQHAAIGQLFQKPVVVIGFDLVTQSNSPFFVPFNGTQAPFGPSATNRSGQAFGVADQQRDDAYSQWRQTGIQGMLEYQFSQGNLTTAAGTSVGATNGTEDSSEVGGTGLSPNDGYAHRGSVTSLIGGRRSTSLVGVIGGAVGGFFVVVFLGLAFVFRRRSSKKRASLMTATRPHQEIWSEPFYLIAPGAGESTAPPGRWTTGYGINTLKQEERHNPLPAVALPQRSTSASGNPSFRASPPNVPPGPPAPALQEPAANIPLLHPRSVGEANHSPLTADIARQELDAGPVPQHLGVDSETLPPGYTQLVDDRVLRESNVD